MNLVLTGFMGTGKTVIGKAIADRLNRKYVDVDTLIEEWKNKKISEIFAEEGEEAFREYESEMIEVAVASSNVVISCGGGAVLKPGNMDKLENNGVVVCLSARPEVIFERVKDGNTRPLLAVKDPLSKIKEILKNREKYYGRCAFSIDTSDLSVEEVVQLVLEKTNLS
ncbi:shikimate kinase [Elusimicrobiota bacterium]